VEVVAVVNIASTVEGLTLKQLDCDNTARHDAAVNRAITEKVSHHSVSTHRTLCFVARPRLKMVMRWGSATAEPSPAPTPKPGR
jgi:hypothetical protein